MNFEEAIIQHIIWLLERNLQIGANPNVTWGEIESRSNGFKILPINPNVDADGVPYKGVLREVNVGPIEQLPVPNPANPPTAYVSFNGGRNDDATDTFLDHLVEVLEIRIEVHLDKKIGVEDRPAEHYGKEYKPNNPVLPITFQGSDLRSDFRKLITHSSLMQYTGTDPVTVQNVVQSEWEFDDRYRGGDQEILIVIFQAVISDERQPNT